MAENSVRQVEVPLFFRMRELHPQPVKRAQGDGEKGEATSYRVVISTEEPVERMDWFGERWVEILSHEPGAIRMSRFEAAGISFLRDHNRTMVDGIVKDGEVVDGRLEGNLTWSEKASSQEVKADVDSGVRPYGSVGYIVHAAQLVGETEGVETWKITDWEPVEDSSVAIPADIQSGFARGESSAWPHQPEGIPQTSARYVCTLRGRGDSPGTQERKPGKQEERGMGVTTVKPSNGQEREASAPEAQQAGGAVVRGGEQRGQQQAERSPAENAAEIARMAQEHGCGDQVADWLERDLSPDAVAREILKAKLTRAGGQPASEAIPDLPQRDRERYSYRRAILGSAENKLDGLEAELHQELGRRMPQGFKDRGGVKVPMTLHPERWSGRAVRPTGQRAMDTLTAGAGAELVFDRPGELIDLLRAEAYTIEAGAQVLTGLTAPVPFPKKTSAPTVYWVGENPASDVTESTIGTGLVTLLPKTMQGALSYSRQLLAIDSIDSEMMVRDELSIGHALAIDLAALHGAGSAGEPTGVYSAADVLSETFGGVPTYAHVVNMTSKVADANAARGSLSFMTTPLMAGKMKQTPEHATATMASWLWRGPYDNGEMAGYPARATTQVSKVLGTGSDHGIIFGNWREMVIGLWGVMELVVDPYTSKKKALIEVASFQMGDVILRHGQSFCKALTAVIA